VKARPRSTAGGTSAQETRNIYREYASPSLRKKAMEASTIKTAVTEWKTRRISSAGCRSIAGYKPWEKNAARKIKTAGDTSE
jgi:hypothetical protein